MNLIIGDSTPEVPALHRIRGADGTIISGTGGIGSGAPTNSPACSRASRRAA